MVLDNGKLLVFSQIDGVAKRNPSGSTLANWFLGMTKRKFVIKIFRFIHHFICIMWTMFLLFSIHQQTLSCF